MNGNTDRAVRSLKQTFNRDNFGNSDFDKYDYCLFDQYNSRNFSRSQIGTYFQEIDFDAYYNYLTYGSTNATVQKMN